MKKNAGLNSKSLKELNRGLILKLIITGKSPSRIELSRATGLTKMTLSNIIAEFIAQKYVCQKEIEPNSSAGRNPIILDITPDAPKIIGVQIGRDEVSAVLCDLKLKIINKSSISLSDETAQSLADKLFDVVSHVECNNVIGIGVSAIGPLEIKSGVILNPTNFFGITDFYVTSLLNEKYNLPVFLNNDMKCAALCEKIFGNGKEFSDFLYVGLSNGVGSGIITADKLYQQGGFSGELGHVSIDYNGAECSCGNKGCLEVYTSIPVVTARLRKATGLSLSFREFCELDTDQVRLIFEDITQKLAYVLIGQVNMLNPKAIIIGHDGASIPKRYLKQLQQSVNEHKLSKQHGCVVVMAAKFGELAPLYGSACSVLNRVFSGELLVGKNK